MTPFERAQQYWQQNVTPPPQTPADDPLIPGEGIAVHGNMVSNTREGGDGGSGGSSGATEIPFLDLVEIIDGTPTWVQYSDIPAGGREVL